MSIKINNNRQGSKRRLVMIRLLLEKLQKRLPFLAVKGSDLSSNYGLDDELEVATTIPDDVKEGHFVVLAVKGEETQRFTVQLGFLTNPAFLRLLKQAEEEYGFKQRGALTVPCFPQELQQILENRCQISPPSGAGNWATCNSRIISSHKVG